MSGKLLISRKEALRRIAAVEEALEAGHPPPGIPTNNATVGAIRAAAEALRIDESSLRRHVGTPSIHGMYEKDHNLRVNWLKYKPKEKAPPPEPEPVDRDAVLEARTRNAFNELVAENKKLVEQLIESQDIRHGLLGLINPPLVPRIVPIAPTEGKGSRTVLLHLSDWHVGEVVDIDEMGGVNSYSIDIFKKRAGRFVGRVKSLMQTHWKGDPPEKIVIIFGGDMITGEIHEELAITNDALSAPAVKTCAETLAGLVKSLREIAPIDVYSLPGNHGRLTKKPQSKGMASNSFDTLITQVVEMMCLELKDVRFFYPKSGDAVFNIYKWVFCAVHGDRIGSRGGQGFIGPIATILRGIHKLRTYYTSQGIIIHHFLVGHFHTSSLLPRGFSNGSLIGPSEYSRDLRADPEPSKQTMLTIHSRRGLIDYQQIYCGDETEGAIYREAV